MSRPSGISVPKSSVSEAVVATVTVEAPSAAIVAVALALRMFGSHPLHSLALSLFP